MTAGHRIFLIAVSLNDGTISEQAISSFTLEFTRMYHSSVSGFCLYRLRCRLYNTVMDNSRTYLTKLWLVLCLDLFVVFRLSSSFLSWSSSSILISSSSLNPPYSPPLRVLLIHRGWWWLVSSNQGWKITVCHCALFRGASLGPLSIGSDGICVTFRVVVAVAGRVGQYLIPWVQSW